MGVGQHPCCKTIASAPQSVTSTPPASQIVPSLAVVAKIIIARPSLGGPEARQIDLALPPPAPPGINPILRI